MTAPLSSVLTEAGGNLAALHPRAYEVYCDGHAAGYVDGYRAGYAARAADEAAEWAPVRDHLAAYVRSFHGLQRRRDERPARRPQTPEQILQHAHQSWGIDWNEGGRRHVA